MRIAFYIEDGLEQIVLTPETDHEKKMLALLHGGRNVEIKNGSFYHCQGGWVRQEAISYSYDHKRNDDNSTIFVMTKPKPEEPSQTTEATHD